MSARAQLRLRGGPEVTAERVLPSELTPGDRLIRRRGTEQVIRGVRAVEKRRDALGVRYHVALYDESPWLARYDERWFEVTPKTRVWRLVEP